MFREAVRAAQNAANRLSKGRAMEAPANYRLLPTTYLTPASPLGRPRPEVPEARTGATDRAGSDVRRVPHNT